MVGIARRAGYALLILFALGAVGCLIPAIPLLGELGPVLVSSCGPWIAVGALIGAALVFLRWRGNRRMLTLTVAAFATFAGLAAIYVMARQIGVANASGVDIDLTQAFLAGSQRGEGLRPITVVVGQQPIDIYRPAARRAAVPAPVFIYIHGGGWNAETLKQREADYRWFVERGYLVVSLEYSLASATRHTWNVVQPQLGCALAWVGANASRYGGDPTRLALWGESAGGNLVLNLSYMANQGSLEPSCAGQLPHVAATIALYPVVDPARMYRNPDMLIGRFGRMMTINYTGGTPDQFPDRYAAIASITHISAAAPATLLIVPEADHLVVPAAAYDFAARARAVGVDMQVIRVPYAEHAFDLRSGSIGNQLVRQAMLRFLSEHGLKP